MGSAVEPVRREHQPDLGAALPADLAQRVPDQVRSPGGEQHRDPGRVHGLAGGRGETASPGQGAVRGEGGPSQPDAVHLALQDVVEVRLGLEQPGDGRVEQRPGPGRHEVGGERDAGHREAGDGAGVGVRALPALPRHVQAGLGAQPGDGRVPGAAEGVDDRVRPALDVEQVPGPGDRSHDAGRQRRPAYVADRVEQLLVHRSEARDPGGLETAQRLVQRQRLVVGPGHRPAEHLLGLHPAGHGVRRGVLRRRLARGLEQQEVGGVVARDVVHRLVGVHDGERVARRPATGLLRAGAEDRPARAHQVPHGRPAGHLRDHEAGVDRVRELGHHPGAAARLDVQGVEVRPGRRRHGHRGLSAELLQHAHDPAAGRQPLRGRGRAAQRDAVDHHDDDGVRDHVLAGGVGAEVGQVLGQRGVHRSRREATQARDVVEGDPRVADDEDGRGLGEEPVQAGGGLRGQRWTVPTARDVRGRSRRRTALRMRGSLVPRSFSRPLRGGAAT